MNTLAKIITAAIIALLLSSCNFDISLNSGIKGNGNVITQKRKINNDFDAIEVSRGLEVLLTQDDNVSLILEADENLHDIIDTQVINGVLKITADVNIKSAEAKRIILSAKTIGDIDTSSGAFVRSQNTLKTKQLSLTSSSGSNMDLIISVEQLNCETSSGSGQKLKGRADKLVADASSGSFVKASELEAKVSRVSASSGAHITVNTSQELTADASSGANIKNTQATQKR